ncbi:MAG: hypothetical protein OJJ54_20470 [Pseudonocardia sp.]|nr:hypothetical protein [Pseudonocardia sp.]
MIGAVVLSVVLVLSLALVAVLDRGRTRQEHRPNPDGEIVTWPAAHEWITARLRRHHLTRANPPR